MSYKKLIDAARNPENQNAGKPEKANGRRQTPPSDEAEEQEVNLSIKVGMSRRRHWAAEAKRNGTTLTATIIEALSEKFGEPE